MSAPTDPAGRLRAPTVVVVAGLLVVALVVTLLVTRLASGSDADAAGGPPEGDAPESTVAAWTGDYGVEQSSDEEVAAALAGGPAPDGSSDFPVLPARCFTPGSDLPRVPCPVASFGPTRPTLVLWGDSHAEMYLPGVVAAARARQVNVVAVLAGGCPPALAVKVPGRPYAGACEQHNATALTYLRSLQRRGADFTVVLNAFWSGYRLAYDRAADDGSGPSAFSDYTRRILGLVHRGTEPLFRTLGQMGIAPDVLAQAAAVMPVVAPCDAGREPYRCDLPRDEALYDEAGQRAWMRDLMALAPGGRYIDPTSAYCDEEVCHSVVDGIPTFWDDIHLGAERTSTMAPYFEPTVEALAGS